MRRRKEIRRTRKACACRRILAAALRYAVAFGCSWRVLVCAAQRRSRIKTSTRHDLKVGYNLLFLGFAVR